MDPTVVMFGNTGGFARLKATYWILVRWAKDGSAKLTLILHAPLEDREGERKSVTTAMTFIKGTAVGCLAFRTISATSDSGEYLISGTRTEGGLEEVMGREKAEEEAEVG